MLRDQGGGGSSAGPQGTNEPRIQRDDIYNHYFDLSLGHVPARLTNVSIVHPYPQLHLPQMPVIHPYNPVDRATEIPIFSVAIKLSVTQKEHLPAGVAEQLALSSIPLENLDVFVCMQTRPWDRPLLLRPHPWLHPAAPEVGSATFATTIQVGVFDLDAGVERLGSSGSLSTHPGVQGMVFSGSQLPIVKQTVADNKKSHCFYSVCVDASTQRAALTLHCLMNEKDYGLVQWALTKSRDLHDFIGGMKSFQNSILNDHVMPWTFLNALETLVYQGKPFCRLFSRRLEYRLNEQGAFQEADHQRLVDLYSAPKSGGGCSGADQQKQDSAKKTAICEQLVQHQKRIEWLVEKIEKYNEACRFEQQTAASTDIQQQSILKQLRAKSLDPVVSPLAQPVIDYPTGIEAILVEARREQQLVQALLQQPQVHDLRSLEASLQQLLSLQSSLEPISDRLEKIHRQLLSVNGENQRITALLKRQVVDASRAQDEAKKKPIREELRRKLESLSALIEKTQLSYDKCVSEKNSVQLVAIQHRVLVEQLQILGFTPCVTLTALSTDCVILEEGEETLSMARNLKAFASALLQSGGVLDTVEALENMNERLGESCPQLEKLFLDIEPILKEFKSVNDANRRVNYELQQQVSSHKPSASETTSGGSDASSDNKKQFDDRLEDLRKKRETCLALLSQSGINNDEAVPRYKRITLQGLCETAQARLSSWGVPGKYDSLTNARANPLRAKGIRVFESLLKQLDDQENDIRLDLARHQGAQASTDGSMVHSFVMLPSNDDTGSSTPTPAHTSGFTMQRSDRF